MNVAQPQLHDPVGPCCRRRPSRPAPSLLAQLADAIAWPKQRLAHLACGAAICLAQLACCRRCLAKLAHDPLARPYRRAAVRVCNPNPPSHRHATRDQGEHRRSRRSPVRTACLHRVQTSTTERKLPRPLVWRWISEPNAHVGPPRSLFRRGCGSAVDLLLA
jgi:hypothetical protein